MPARSASAARGGASRDVAGFLLPLLGLVAQDDPAVRLGLPLEPIDRGFRRRPWAGVIDDDDLDVRIVLRLQRAHGLLQKLRPVEMRHAHRDAGIATALEGIERRLGRGVGERAQKLFRTSPRRRLKVHRRRQRRRPIAATEFPTCGGELGHIVGHEEGCRVTPEQARIGVVVERKVESSRRKQRSQEIEALRA